MVWERFHHICRRSLAPLRPGESLTVRIRTVEADPDTAFYGSQLKPGTLPRRILDGITAAPNEDRARQLLEFYAGLDLARETAHPLRLTRLTVYLAWLAALLAILFGIYQFLVMRDSVPLSGILQTRGVHLVALLREYGWAFTIVVAVLLALALLMVHGLKGLADWTTDHGRRGVARLLALPGARAAHADLETVVLFPLGPDAMDGKLKIASHLWKLEEEGENIREEVAALVRCRHRDLIERCEKQMCMAYTFSILLIVMVAAVFLAGVYSPAAVLSWATT